MLAFYGQEIELLFCFLHKINSVEVKLRLTLYCMSIKYKESGDVQ